MLCTRGSVFGTQATSFSHSLIYAGELGDIEVLDQGGLKGHLP
jgi:hypothetical protein